MERQARSGFGAAVGWLTHRWDAWLFRRSRLSYYDYLSALLIGSAGTRTLKDIFQQDAQRYDAKSRRGRLARHWLATYQYTGGDLYATWMDCFPDDELALIRTAQVAGRGALTHTLQELASVQTLLQQSARIVWGLVWPGVLAVVLLVAMAWSVPAYTLPHLLDAFAMVPPDYFGLMTRRLIVLAGFVERYFSVLLVAVVAMFWAVVWSLPNATGPWRRWLDGWSVWGIYRSVAGLRFLSFLIIALGRDPTHSTQLRSALSSQRDGASGWLASHIDRMLDRIDQGVAGPATFDSGLFSREYFWFLNDMVLARGLVDGLMLLRDRLRTHSLEVVARQAAIVRWVLLLFCLGCVLGLALWHYIVMDEMRRAMMFYFAGQQ